MKTTFCLLAGALLAASGASAQTFIDPAAGEPLASALPTPPAPAGAYCQRFAGGGSLTYVGVSASHDACHAQFTQLREAFAATEPTRVYYEKPDSGTDSTEAATIGRLGEAGYVRLLAQRRQVPAERLDDPVAEYEFLKTKIEPEQLKLYYLLRASRPLQAARASKAIRVKAMRALIANSTYFIPGCEQVVCNLQELETAYRKHLPTSRRWWQAPAASLNFNTGPTGAGSTFIARINQAASEFREQTTYRRLAAQAQAGQRVLVVVDFDHLPAAVAARSLARK